MTKINSGRTTPGGSPVYFCECLMRWVPVFEDQLKRAGVIKFNIDIWQGSYSGSVLSAGTHTGGGALDIGQTDETTVTIARRLGAAAWARMWPGNTHTHLVLIGCPHNLPARYQVAAYKAGYNGLGWLGRGGSDDGKRVTIKNWDSLLGYYESAMKGKNDPFPANNGRDRAPTFDPNNKGRTVSLSITRRMAQTGGTHYHVTSIQRMLISWELYKGKLDGQYGPQTRAAYKAWQNKIGFYGSDADGIPGRISLNKLVTRFGYRMVA